MKKNIIITILATALVLITLLIIVGLIANSQENKVVPTTNNTFKDQFMEGCVEGSNYSYCSCTYDDLIKTNGENEVIKMSVKYAEDNIIPDTFIESAKKCIHLYTK